VVIQVHHIYRTNPIPCPSGDCPGSSHIDPGQVNLSLASYEAEGTQERRAFLNPFEALMLADRLTRAAHFVLETQEGVPSAERELRRLQAGSQM
jgi:hypothetical protein